SMAVGVEDATSSASITLRVCPHSTIAELKEQVRRGTGPAARHTAHTGPPRSFSPPQVFHDYGFHPLVQRWIIGQCLCVDDRTVS
ncbi:HOIL1 protein, partial [Columbina picui]|nr:HOIL1 protein [Columbina picui]